MTLSEVQQDTTLKILHKSGDRACGGKTITEQFLNLLVEILGSDTLDEFRANFLSAFEDMKRGFETKRRLIRYDKSLTYRFAVPTDLIETFQKITNKNIHEALEESQYAGKVTHTADKLNVSPDIVENMFLFAAEYIVGRVEELMKELNCSDLDKIVMVGGVSESPIIQHKVRAAFEGEGLDIFIAREPDLAVLKGAVIFGHLHTTRGCVEEHTYGLVSEMEPSLRKKAQTLSIQDDWKDCSNPDHGPPQWKCMVCEVYLCTSCKIAHKRGKRSRRHPLLHISEKEKEDAVRQEIFCNLHDNKENDLFCLTHQQSICAICAITSSHRGNHIVSLDKYAEEVRSDVGSVCAEVDRIVPQYDERIENLSRKLSNAEEISDMNCKCIDTAMQQAIAKIKQNAINLKAREKRKCKSMRKSIQVQIEDLKKEMKVTTEIVYRTRDFLENCSDNQLVNRSEMYKKELALVRPPKSESVTSICHLQQEEIDRKLCKDLSSK